MFYKNNNRLRGSLYKLIFGLISLCLIIPFVWFIVKLMGFYNLIKYNLVSLKSRLN